MRYYFTVVSLFFLFHSSLYATVRVMPLGDSITYDDSYADQNNPRPASVRHAYRNYLYYRLRDARYSVDFVGSRIAGTAVRPSFDPENEGYPGETTDYIGSIIYNKLRQNPADIILLHIGTNDRWRINGSGNYMGGIYTIFNEIDRFERDYHHPVRVIVALIIGRRNNDYASFTNTFNANLRNIVNSRIGQGDKLTLIDMQHNAGLNYHNDFRDPAHPTNSGYDKMSALWYNSLKHFLPTPAPEIPLNPSNLNAQSVTHNSATLTWNDQSNNETGFRIYQENTHIASVGTNVTSFNLTNLTPSTNYTYRVVAYNNVGASQAISTTFKTNNPPKPKKPTNVSVANVGTTGVTLRWHDQATYEKGFKIYQGNKLIAIVSRNTTKYIVKNLNPRETYTFKIVAYNNTGNSDVATISITTKDDYAWLPAVYHVILF